jgi:hypothetical protein
MFKPLLAIHSCAHSLGMDLLLLLHRTHNWHEDDPAHVLLLDVHYNVLNVFYSKAKRSNGDRNEFTVLKDQKDVSRAKEHLEHFARSCHDI